MGILEITGEPCSGLLRPGAVFVNIQFKVMGNKDARTWAIVHYLVFIQ